MSRDWPSWDTVLPLCLGSRNTVNSDTVGVVVGRDRSALKEAGAGDGNVRQIKVRLPSTASQPVLQVFANSVSFSALLLWG